MKKLIPLVLVFVLVLSCALFSVGAANEKSTISSYSAGDIIEFGSYPQKKVTDQSLIAQLNEMRTVWTMCKFYIGGEQADFMKYADVALNGERYRAVTFSQYRPMEASLYSSKTNSYQDDNSYGVDAVYWFKYEPIQWKVLDPSTGLVVSDMVLDAQAFTSSYYISNSTYYPDIATRDVFSNNYEISDIRAWLANDFTSTAFNSYQQSVLCETILDNTALSSSYSIGNTTDKVYLLSRNDAANTSYFANSNARRAMPTDYAKCFGVNVNKASGVSSWRLRTAGTSSGQNAFVSDDGTIKSATVVDATFRGIRPAMNISAEAKLNIHSSECSHEFETIGKIDAGCLSEGYTGDVRCMKCGIFASIGETIPQIGSHKAIETVTDPTCVGTGLIVKSCETCGYIYEETVIPATGHTEIAEIEAKEPGCNYSGRTARLRCTVCDAITQWEKEIPATGHKFADPVDEDVKPATCTSTGSKVVAYYCAVCSKPIKKDKIVLERTPHNYAVQKIVVPTCTYEGYTSYLCKDCGASNRDNFTSKLPHTPLIYPSVAPTCTHYGFKGGSYCGDCSIMIQEREVVPATGHTDLNGDKVCDVCGVTGSVVDNDPASLCSCNCHKTGFMAFIYKIQRFFWKLFGSNKFCSCGAIHY